MGRTKSGTTRRTFLSMGAASLAGARVTLMNAAPKKREVNDLLRIGLILGEWAHSTGWGPMMNGINGDKTFPKRTGMIYTHVWHIKREVAEEFAKKYGVGTVVKSFDDIIYVK